REQATDPGQVHRVVGVPAIGRAAPRRDQAGVAQLAQVVRDQVLGLTHEAGQLRDHPVAPGQLAQETPAQGMPGQLQELGWRRVRCVHSSLFTSIQMDTSSRFDWTAGAPTYKDWSRGYKDWSRALRS